MGKQYTFKIGAFCVINEEDFGEPVTEQLIQQDVFDLLKNDLCINAEVIVTDLKQKEKDVR